MPLSPAIKRNVRECRCIVHLQRVQRVENSPPAECELIVFAVIMSLQLIELDCETARRYHHDRGSPRSNSLSRRVASYCIALHYREFRKSSLYIIVLISLCGLSLSFRFLRSKRIEGFCLERELLR